MAFFLVFVGLLLIVTGARDTYLQFGQQITADVTANNYAMPKWVLAVGGVGALGYINELRTFSHYFLALILIALLINNQGFFAALMKGVATAPVAPAQGNAATTMPGLNIVDPAAPSPAQQSMGITFPPAIAKWRPCNQFPFLFGPC